MTEPPTHFLRGDFGDPRVVKLLQTHVATARAATARGSAHALDLQGLQAPDIEFWTLWQAENLCAIGALRTLDAAHGEVKSMHTALSVRNRGFAGLMLRHLIARAWEKGLARLSLETGSWDYFIPARAFYRRNGFVDCAPFGDYLPDSNSVFLTRGLP